MAKIKKNLSLEQTLVEKASKRAEELGYNFSSYITYLINEDLKNKNANIIVINQPEQAITKEETILIEEPKENKDNEVAEEKLDNEIENLADNIMNNM